MSSADIRSAIIDMAQAICSDHSGGSVPALVAVSDTANPFSERLAVEIARCLGDASPPTTVDLGSTAGASHSSPASKSFVLFDVRVETGSTLLGALQLLSAGSPEAPIKIAVLLDCSVNELPFKIDYFGHKAPGAMGDVTVISPGIGAFMGSTSVS